MHNNNVILNFSKKWDRILKVNTARIRVLVVTLILLLLGGLPEYCPTSVQYGVTHHVPDTGHDL